MPYRSYCHDEYEHRSKAEDDARWGHRDNEYYDPYASDPCKVVYTEEYDRQERRIEERREDERREEAQREQFQLDHARERRYYEELEEERYLQPEPEYPEPEYEPSFDDDDIPF